MSTSADLSNNTVRNSPPSTPTRKTTWVAVIGVLLIGSLLYRQYFLATFKPLPDVPDVASLSPEVKALGKRRLALEAALAKSPGAVSKRWDLADVYQKLGQIELAEAELRKIVKSDPNSVEAHVGLANMRLARREFVEAERDFRRIIRQFAHNRKIAQAWGGLGATLYHQERYLEAEAAASASLKLKPNSANNMFIRSAATTEFALRSPNPLVYAEALRGGLMGLQQTLAVWPDKPQLYYLVGRVYAALREKKNAVKYLRRAKELAPNNVGIDMELAKALNASGKRDVAMKVVEEAVQKHPENADLLDLHGQLLRYSDAPDAPQRMFQALEKAVQLKPQDAGLQQRFASACMRVDKIDQAQAAFEESIRLNPNIAFPHQQLSIIYKRKGEAAKAAASSEIATGLAFNEQQLKDIESHLQLHPKNANLHLIVADRYRDLGWISQARGEYLFVLRLDAKNKRAKAGLARLAQIKSQTSANTTQP